MRTERTRCMSAIKRASELSYHHSSSGDKITVLAQSKSTHNILVIIMASQSVVQACNYRSVPQREMYALSLSALNNQSEIQELRQMAIAIRGFPTGDISETDANKEARVTALAQFLRPTLTGQVANEKADCFYRNLQECVPLLQIARVTCDELAQAVLLIRLEGRPVEEIENSACTPLWDPRHPIWTVLTGYPIGKASISISKYLIDRTILKIKEREIIPEIGRSLAMRLFPENMFPASKTSPGGRAHYAESWSIFVDLLTRGCPSGLVAHDDTYAMIAAAEVARVAITCCNNELIQAIVDSPQCWIIELVKPLSDYYRDA